MNRQEKIQLVDQLKEDFTNAEATFLVTYRGLTVAQMEKLRSQLRHVGARLQVAKARLAKRAAGGSVLDPFFRDQIALIFTPVEAPAVAKIIVDFAKKNGALAVAAGVMEQSLLHASDVSKLAALPSREVLLAQVAGTLQAPIVKAVRAMSMVLCKLAWGLSELQKKKSQE